MHEKIPGRMKFNFVIEAPIYECRHSFVFSAVMSTSTQTSLEQVQALCNELISGKITRRRDALKQLPYILKVEHVYSTFCERTEAKLNGKMDESTGTKMKYSEFQKN